MFAVRRAHLELAAAGGFRIGWGSGFSRSEKGRVLFGPHRIGVLSKTILAVQLRWIG